MSLGKAKTRVKEGVKQLQSIEGLQRVVVHLGLGVAIGVIVDLILQYIMAALIAGGIMTREQQIVKGFTIFPNSFDPTTGEAIMAVDDLLLLIITVLLVFSKKFWMVIGFFIGWYFSSYLGLYTALGLEQIDPLP